VLNGQKLFISFAAQAVVALVFARTPEGRVGAFLVEPTTKGWSVGRPFELMAFGGVEAAPLFLDGVRVEEDAAVGDIGRGFDVLLAGEARGKIRVAAICVGVAQRAIEEAGRYALQRTHRGEPIGHKFATIQALLGDMQASTLAARALVRSAATMVDAGLPVDETAAAARLVAGRTAREVTGAALQVCGAYGLTRELPVERLYREGKFFEVAQGVSEIQRVVVARHVLAGREHELSLRR
jgi:alkylation response protein AidB-like acyl-CoA dehydrogenase